MKLTDVRVDVTEEALQAAMKAAVEHGLLPRGSLEEEYLRRWDAMRRVLEAAAPHMGLSNTAAVFQRPE